MSRFDNSKGAAAAAVAWLHAVPLRRTGPCAAAVLHAPLLQGLVWLAGLVVLASALNLLTPPAWAQPAAERRVALVIGNAAYADRPLRNPINDAQLMQATLRDLGFQVQVATDVDRRGLLAALRDFESRARGAEVALFYFAGHGAQVGGANYLIPVNAPIRSETDVPDEALDAASVLRRIEEGRARVGLVILDACRDNPYPGSMRSAARGLARMPAPTGTIVAYATAPGSTADDGSGSHGVYTSALARQLVIPGLDIKEVFDRAAQEVERVTGGRQKPREEIGLRGRFVLQEVPPADAAVPPPAAAEQSGGSSPAAAVALAAAPEPASASASAQAAREPAEPRPAPEALVSMPAPRKPPERPPAWLTASATPASTSPTASGNGGAGVDPAPSRAYGGLLVAAIRPNIVYAAQSETNFEIEVFVTTRPDGRISSVRITRPSASRVWDDAVVRALEKTERLPPDLNGQVPALIAREGLLVTLRPRDLAR